MKHRLDYNEIRSALIKNSVNSLSSSGDLILLHDPSDIRKEHSKKLDNIGKVLDLKKNVINGYSTLNTVAVDIFNNKLRLLSTDIYSNREETYVTKKELNALEYKKQEKDEEIAPASTDRESKVKELVKNNQHKNLSTITEANLYLISDELKNGHSPRTLTHVFDRGFDDNNLFTFIDKDLKDKFVIRLKITRNSEDYIYNKKNKKKYIKIKDVNFSNKYNKTYQKILIKNKLYQDVRCSVEYGVTLCGYNVIKVQLFKRDGQPIFKQPMILITNHNITSNDDALSTYKIYLKRSKIEGVFKFLKNVLGWEEFQIRDFESIKTLLTLCYFIAGYFYEIESILLEQDFVQFLANLGGGKGKITRYYILEGFAKLFIKNNVDHEIQRNNISQEKLEKMMKWAMMMSKGMVI